jgi:catalase
MNGYGSHTYKLVNAEKKAVYCKFHWKPNQGIKNLSVERAAELASSDPDYAIRDLYNAIANGDYPSWTLQLQIMTYEQASKAPFNPFDLTKVWPHADYPLMNVGKLVLNRNPVNYFSEVEQLAFAPSHMIPGIEPSPDKMLQGRLFSYADTHRHRLGANYLQIPVNCPFATRVNNYQRDGPACVTDNQKGAPNYYPNSFSGPEHHGRYVEHRDNFTEDIDRYDTSEDDNFSQAAVFYRKVLNEEERKRLIHNIADHVKNALPFIQQRAIKNFTLVDSEFGKLLQLELNKHLCPKDSAKL